MTLRFLDFECSEDAEGGCTCEAMASVGGARWPDVLEEARQVLVWAHRVFPSGPGPLDEGFDWDCAVDARVEPDRAFDLNFDPALGQWRFERPDPGGEVAGFHTLTLTLCGPAAFAQAFDQRWLTDGGESL